MTTKKETTMASAPPTFDPADEAFPEDAGVEARIVDIDDVIEVERSLVPAETGNVIMGLGHLAQMSDAEFTRRLEMLKAGRERVALIQKSLMVSGVDYGKVKGIDRPFLHLPGAEALEKFYGFAAEQKTVRIDGDGILTPPYTYRTDTRVHLGDTAGPVVAEVSGACNPWEERYRYRWGKAICPKCGREGLIKGKADGKLKGKWWCPSREGGCNSTFEPAATNPDGSLVVSPPGKIANDDPYSLEETIIQMSQKRSYVAAIRRATGTSGLFTIDEDSPSVIAQSEASDEGGATIEPTITAGPEVKVAAGAKVEPPTELQLRRLTSVSKDKDINAEAMASLLGRLFGLEVEGTNSAVIRAVKSLTGEQVGQLIWSAETGEVPS